VPSFSGLSSLLLGLNFEALQSSETPMGIYQSTRCNISEGKKTLSRPVEEASNLVKKDLCL
jgi:hypothetical protein